MNRRAFISLLGGAAAAWPLAARAQQAERTRRIGFFDTLAADDPEASVRYGAFLQGLQTLGWAVGRTADELRRAIASFARGATDGLIVLGGPAANAHRHLIAELAARHRVPAVYAYRYYATAGGLISYGPDVIEQFRFAASYVDRILKGEKPADLPVQAPTRYGIVLNLKTAKALGLDVPAQLQQRADEVI
jgi:putative ABC transport system substrate-binding protein